MSRGKRSAAALLMLEHEVSTSMLARVLGVGDSHVFKYTNGHRPLSAVMRSKVRREFPRIADALLAACDDAFTARSVETVVRIVEPSSAASWKPAPNQPDADWDGVLYSWDEWKRLFGDPTPRVDTNGRSWGLFPTEPCFCED